MEYGGREVVEFSDVQEHTTDNAVIKAAIQRVRFLIDCDPFAELLLEKLGLDQ